MNTDKILRSIEQPIGRGGKPAYVLPKSESKKLGSWDKEDGPVDPVFANLSKMPYLCVDDLKGHLPDGIVFPPKSKDQLLRARK